MLLVIDDLERVMEEDKQRQRYVVSEQAAPVLRALLEAFDATAGDSRLLLTSRYRLYLDGLEKKLLDLPLPPLSPAAQGKLMARQLHAVQSGPTDIARAEGERLLKERAKLLAAVPGIARGNPGLQDLIGRKLVLSRVVTSANAAKVVEEMEAWFAQGELPSDAEAREFLESLAIDQLITLAGDLGRTLLRRLTLFSLSVPDTVAEKMAGEVGASLARLRDLGLVDRHEDVVDPHVPAVAANSLAAARVAPLDDDEQKTVARQVTQDLFIAWGGAAAETDWPPMCDLQLVRLGLLAEDAEIVAACAAVTVQALTGGSAEAAANLGQAAIELLDAQQRTVPWRLLRATAQAAATRGDGPTADLLIARGVGVLAQQRAAGTPVDADEAALLPGAHAERLFMRGELDEALRILRGELLPVLERLGHVRARAITMGQIADILTSRGDLDEALRIREDEELPVYQRLGDVQSRAMTMGQITDILQSRGELEKALRILQNEVLPAFERLGDVRSRAVTMGRIADILESRGDLDQALRIRQMEQLPIFQRLDDAENIANTMWKLARIDLAQKRYEEALSRIGEAYAIVLRLGRAEAIAVIGMRLGQILAASKRRDEALVILQRSADLFRKLGREEDAQEAEVIIAELGLG